MRRFLIDENISPRYRTQLLYHEPSLAGKMQGTTGRQRLNKDALLNLEIPLPPLSEQRAIANAFQAIDEKQEPLSKKYHIWMNCSTPCLTN